MSTWLTILGGVFQFVGASLVLAEIAAARDHEFGIVPPWTRFGRWLRAKIRRPPHTLYIDLAEGTVVLNGSLRAKMRPGPVAADATDAKRIAWLERYIRCR